MLKIKLYFLLSAVLLAYSSMVGAKKEAEEGIAGISHCPSSTLACVCTTEKLACGFVPPGRLSIATNIQSIVFTFKDINISVDDISVLNAANWGVRFSSGIGPGQSNFLYCNAKNCFDGAIEITANNALVYVVTSKEPTSRINVFTGTVVITLAKFQNGQIPRILQNLITGSGGIISITPTYSDSHDNADGTAPAYGANSYQWQPDLGALINPPSLSVLSRANGMVVNINPPADLTSANPDPDTVPTTLKAVAPGNPSGYILAFWQARVSATDLSSSCSTSGMWNFVPNPISFNSLLTTPDPPAPNPPVLTCGYTPYVEATNGIGGTNSTLGCSSVPVLAPPPVPSPQPYYLIEKGVPALTADSVAVPATFTYIDKPTFLAKLIANPAKEYPVPGTCMQVVYVPGTQTSYGKMGIKIGEVFGVMGWVLNSASTTADPTPNLSLSHSNLSFMTAGTATLASLEKDPSLPLTNGDCFVATAASGDINSNSVFYWRVLRDEYLTDLGITKFYYKHGPKWANWLNKHPKYKPAINFVLEKTGAFFYFSALYSKQAWEWTSEHSELAWNWTSDHAKIFFSFLSDIWAQEASADETPRSDEIFHSNPSLHPDKEEPDLAIYPDDKISFDVALTAGVLFPSTDKNLFNKFYPSSTIDFELASNAIIWTSDVGWSLGAKGIYAQNSQKSMDHTLGSATQENERFVYFGALELVAGVRYRNPYFLYLQPGVFAGAGVLRFREEGKATGDNGKNSMDTKDQIMGVSQWSPVFDFGANLDISLSTLFLYSERELDLSHDILLRLTALYRINPSRALDMSGLVLNAGFAFLF